MQRAAPFLRWAGGKQSLCKHLFRFVPQHNKNTTYWEPFLGGGALFFALDISRAVLSDLNPHLIECYKAVRRHPKLVHEKIYEHGQRNSENYYYQVREFFNEADPGVDRAAAFIYLNKASYNGIYRVNQKGKYNVPYGRKEPPALPSEPELLKISRALKHVKLKIGSFETIVVNAKKGDFIYMDPPYPPINGSSYFTHYTKSKFGKKEQKLVALIAEKMAAKGCNVMISNAATPEIIDLYKGWNQKELEVIRWITCKSTKHKVSELIITNY